MSRMDAKGLRLYRLPDYLESLHNTRFSESMREGGFPDDARMIMDRALDQAEKCLVVVGAICGDFPCAANDSRRPCEIVAILPGEQS